ncbi:hypothetical protein HanRHA438_Chr13g0578621 [Helianthus annuus]|nr:hypothetical protein HanRHA438_Chr13g0578621 [Helianthus annuus]
MNPSWWGTLKAKRVPVPQNLEMYYGTSSTSSAKSIVPCNPEMYYGTSSSSSARPGSHAPLQTMFVTSTDLYGNPIQVPVKPAPVKPAPTTDLYGNPLPSVASQRHRSTVAPSSLDPRNCSQAETAFMLKLSKMSAMVNPREVMTVLNITVVQMKMFQLQLRVIQL